LIVELGSCRSSVCRAISILLRRAFDNIDAQVTEWINNADLHHET
jgi:hypothetical protein